MAGTTAYMVDTKNSSEEAFREAAKHAKESYVVIGKETVPSIMAAFTEKASNEWLATHGLLKQHDTAQAIMKRSSLHHAQQESMYVEAKEKLKEVPRQFFESLRAGELGHKDSTRVLGSPGTFALLFQDCGWGGPSLWLPSGAYPDLRRVWPWSGNWNDRVSSLQLFLVSVWLFEHIQFGGRSISFTGVVGANTNPVGINCLVADGFNDKASSAIVF